MSKIPEAISNKVCEDGKHQFFVLGNGVDVRCVVCGWGGTIIPDGEKTLPKPATGYGYNWHIE